MSDEIWVLLWSKNQNCFHIEPASELCRKNTNKLIVGGAINDYHPIHVGKREDCDQVADAARGLLKEKEINRV